MHSIGFECEVVTPMFLGGADHEAELRAPSIKAAMRWWFRAMMGGGLFDKLGKGKNSFLSGVREAESKTFGSTDAVSPFRLSIVDSGLSKDDCKRWCYRIDEPAERGLCYLGYGLSDRNFVIPGKKFTLEVTLRTTDSQKENWILGSLWMLANFGTLGARSSRGFGCFQISCANDDLGERFPKVTSIADLKEGFKRTRRLFSLPESSSNDDLPPFSIVHPRAWRCLVLNEPKGNPLPALNSAGIALRKFREAPDPSNEFERKIPTKSGNIRVIRGQHSREYKNVVNFGISRGLLLPETSIFGLPHPFQLSSPGKKVTMKKVTIVSETRQRRKSPLFIHVYKWKQTYVSYQAFKAEFVDGKIKFYDPKVPNQAETVGGTLPFNELDSFIGQNSANAELLWE
ncbi:MAG: type III-B CRISPR module RAMP protein Cmr1 [Candidatus Eisenbacteria bacterium]|nr:type III-B CRISPR module RAMP protein Cmr1 [Candidatus Eisenbacteria bacterium]